MNALATGPVRDVEADDRPASRRPRGLILTNLFATPAEPARATFNQQQFRELAKVHDLLVIVPLARRYPCAPNLRRTQSASVPGLGIVYFDVWHPAVLGRITNASFIERRVRRLLGEELARWNPDYVLGSFAYPEGVAAVKLGRRFGIPAFIKVHGSDINGMLDGWGIGPQIRKALRSAEGVVAVSKALAERAERVRGASAGVLLLYNGVDRAQFRPMDRSAARRELGLDDRRRSILYVGNLKRDKGVLDVVQAFADISSAHADVDLDIVGAGPAIEEVTSLIDRLGLKDRVRLRGTQSHSMLPAWFAAAHLLCLPSYAEGVPNVVVEALACGRPVVATRVGGIPEILAEASGHLVEARNTAQLSRALSNVLSRSWEPAALSASLPVSDWRDNGARLATFLSSTNRLAKPDHSLRAVHESGRR